MFILPQPLYQRSVIRAVHRHVAPTLSAGMASASVFRNTWATPTKPAARNVSSTWSVLAIKHVSGTNARIPVLGPVVRALFATLSTTYLAAPAHPVTWAILSLPVVSNLKVSFLYHRTISRTVSSEDDFSRNGMLYSPASLEGPMLALALWAKQSVSQHRGPRSLLLSSGIPWFSAIL